MTEAIGQQAPQVAELSEESKQKVMLIRDINSIYRLLKNGKDLTVRQFNDLYDSPICEIEQTYANYRHQYACKSVVI